MLFYRRWLRGAVLWVIWMTFAAIGPGQESPGGGDEGGPSRWAQSYNAGYTDEKGAHAGGSEVMHLVAHKGKLYAANGYWVDSRWVIPPDAEKQSAQVLRLDSAAGRWQVDLDTAKANDFDLRYMKGNILKSVTFSIDGAGRPLAKKRRLLVMAAGANFERGGAVSAWVKDDSSGKWIHTLVRHGSSAGGLRWVPRDMEVYTDKVTGVERLFLLLGNPGVTSGVYDPTLPGKIRWDRHVEFPFLTTGSLKTRPLGLAQANGFLYLSEGSSIYRRDDGRRPGYTRVLNLEADTDTDVGGIRGLTTISNPTGPGDSLLFLWAPGHRSRSQVKRLDPVKGGRHILRDEASMADLMSAELGVKVSYTLGAHNRMLPVKHPKTGELVHLIGFQGNIKGKNHLRWKGSQLYAGAMYAVRSADQTYKVLEVNNTYTPGKTVLVSPRTFCLSPFGDNHLYIGGHDSSRLISDDMAWVFRAPVEVALGLRSARPAPTDPPDPPPAARLLAGPVFELRIYVANENRFQHLIKRFRDHTDRIFKKHGLESAGYWITPEGRGGKGRRFVYVLKHPSRYAAYRNWNSFTRDKEWEAVLDIPEFQRLLAEKPTSIFMTENEYSATSMDAIEKAGGVYELRTYVANPGKLAKLNARFRDKTIGLFRKHGIRNVGYWTPFDMPEAANTLVYLVHHASRERADANWMAFGRDPLWRKIARESQFDGEYLLKAPDRIYLKALDFSPLK